MTALAISSGVPSLPSGTLLEIIFNRCWPVSEDARRPLSPGVSMEPGLTAFTRMRRSFKSVVHDRANNESRLWWRCKHYSWKVKICMSCELTGQKAHGESSMDAPNPANDCEPPSGLGEQRSLRRDRNIRRL